MNWIYLSPHLDDVVLSCGGLVVEQAAAGDKVEIWTIFAGDPPGGVIPTFAQYQHDQWGLGPDAFVHRRLEDQRACALLGAEPRHFSQPDCVYRRSPRDGRPLYDSETAIFGPIHPEERDLIGTLQTLFTERLSSEIQIVCPLGVGGHVDHRLTRGAAETLDRPLWYYAEMPYVVRDPAWREGQVPLPRLDAWDWDIFPVGQKSLDLWGAAAGIYTSQIPVLWGDEARMRKSLRAYTLSVGGVRLFRRVVK